MAQTSDINVHTLMNYEKNFLRVESLKKANDKRVNEIAKLDIYRELPYLVLRGIPWESS